MLLIGREVASQVSINRKLRMVLSLGLLAQAAGRQHRDRAVSSSRPSVGTRKELNLILARRILGSRY